MKATSIAIIIGAMLSVASAGFAYPYPELYEADAAGAASLRVGGAGIYGTGGKQDYTITCSHCHIAPSGLVGIQLTLLDGQQWETGAGGQPAYKPGFEYHIRVALTGEHLKGANEGHNGFAATVENSAGQRSGILRSDGAGCAATSSSNCQPLTAACRGQNSNENNNSTTSIIGGSCKAVVNQGNYSKKDLVSWTFYWTAPAVGAGTVTIFAGVVDGGGSPDPFSEPTLALRTDLSSLNDDTANTELVLLEGN